MWRSDVSSLWKSAASTIGSISESVQENVNYYVDVEVVKATVANTVSAVGTAVVGAQGSFEDSQEGGAGEELDSYKKMLEDAQMHHVQLSKELSSLLAVKEMEILAYKEKYGLLTEEDLKTEKMELASLLSEKKVMESTYQSLESKYQSHLSKVNEADASILKMRTVQDKYAKLVDDLQQFRELSDAKDREKHDTIEGLISEYSQLSADMEKKTKLLKDTTLENERLEIKLQALENNICEFADRESSQRSESSIKSSKDNGGISTSMATAASAIELKDLRSKVLNLQYDMREKDLSINSLKEQLLKQTATSKPLMPPTGATNLDDTKGLADAQISRLESELKAEKESRLSKDSQVEKLQEKILGLKADIEKIVLEKKEAEGLAKDLHDKNKKLSFEMDGLKKIVDSANLENIEKGKLNASQTAKIANLEAQLTAVKTQLDGDAVSTVSLQSSLEADLKKSIAQCEQLKLEILESSETLQRVKDQLKKEIDSVKDQLKKEAEKFQLTLDQKVSEIKGLMSEIAANKNELERQSSTKAELDLCIENLHISEKSLQERVTHLSSSSSDSQSENQKIIEDLQAQNLKNISLKQREIDQSKQELKLFQLKSQKEITQLQDDKEKAIQRATAETRELEQKSHDKLVSELKEEFEAQRFRLQKEASDLLTRLSDISSQFDAEKIRSNTQITELSSQFEAEKIRLNTQITELSCQFETEKSRLSSENKRDLSRTIAEKDELFNKSVSELNQKFDKEKQDIDRTNTASLQSAIAQEKEKHILELESSLRVNNSMHETTLQKALESFEIEANSQKASEIEALNDSFRVKIEGIEKSNKLRCEEYEESINTLKSDIQTVEARFEIKTREACAQIENQKKIEFEVALAAAKNECKQLIDAAQADRDEYIALYTKECKQRKTIHNKLMEMQGNIRVFCRVRPILEVESKSGQDANVTSFPGNDELLIQKDPQTKTRFEYDKTFPPGTLQETVFESVQPLCISALDGFNVCIFAYGQTGSGKTYTMDGAGASAVVSSSSSSSSSSGTGGDFPNIGVSPRCFLELFKVVAERQAEWTYTLTFSMLEIYNESILDLLNDKSAKEKDKESNKLDVRQGPDGNIVPGLTEVPVSSFEQIRGLLAQGQRNRAVGSHDMNEHSSRSHSIITVNIKGKSKLETTTVTGKLHLIDLAGSERVGKTDASGDRLKEAQNINRSLSALGDVIHALGEKSSAGKKGGSAAGNAVHIPYRNSKLTFLLQDSLGGNSKVLMFVNISPASYNVSESLCSLQFASRCRSVELGQAKKQIDKK